MKGYLSVFNLHMPSVYKFVSCHSVCQQNELTGDKLGPQLFPSNTVCVKLDHRVEQRVADGLEAVGTAINVY